MSEPAEEIELKVSYQKLVGRFIEGLILLMTISLNSTLSFDMAWFWHPTRDQHGSMDPEFLKIFRCESLEELVFYDELKHEVEKALPSEDSLKAMLASDETVDL